VFLEVKEVDLLPVALADLEGIAALPLIVEEAEYIDPQVELFLQLRNQM